MTVDRYFAFKSSHQPKKESLHDERDRTWLQKGDIKSNVQVYLNVLHLPPFILKQLFLAIECIKWKTSRLECQILSTLKIVSLRVVDSLSSCSGLFKTNLKFLPLVEEYESTPSYPDFDFQRLEGLTLTFRG